MQIGHTKAGPIAGHRVAVTGLGAVSVCGIGPDALWQGLLAPPPSGLRRVPDFDPTSWLDARHARHYDRFAQFAIAAADQAIADAGDLSAHAPLDPARAGVIFGAGEGGFLTIEAQVTNYVRGGARKVSPRMIPMMMANAGTTSIAMRQGFQGPAETIVTACAAGTHSIAAAARLIATGLCDVAVGGGAEAGITEVSLAAFSNMTALSTSGISRPFDAARDGFVMGEGAGALILEEWDHALARGALIYAELLGAGASSDAHHLTAPHPDGHGAALAMIRSATSTPMAPRPPTTTWPRPGPSPRSSATPTLRSPPTRA
jgi:3-oxoacyl-[acyl-carrier-protein] synthase II